MLGAYLLACYKARPDPLLTMRSAAAEMLNVGTRTAASAATVRNEGMAGTVIETVTATKY